MRRHSGELDSRTMRKILFMAATLVLLYGAALLSGCGDDDNPTGPASGDDENYIFYITGDDGNDVGSEATYFRYHSAQQKVDTVGSLGDRFSYGLRAVSADGERLYFSHEGAIHVVNSRTFETITVLNYAGDVAVSSDNQLIAIAGDDIWILSVPDYSVIFHDTTAGRAAVFSSSCETFYCGSVPYSPSVYVLDLQAEEPQLEERPLPYPELQLRKIIPSVDETKWLLYRKLRHDVFAFEVYDVGIDSLVFSHVFGPGYGDMAMTPDGRYVFYTSPGTLNSDMPPKVEIYVFDIETMRLIDGIPTSSPIQNGLPVGQLAMTPDGKRLLALGSRGTGQFITVSTAQLAQDEFYYLGQVDVNRVDLYDVYCQNSFTN